MCIAVDPKNPVGVAEAPRPGPLGIVVHPKNPAVNLKNTKGVAVDPKDSCALQ